MELATEFDAVLMLTWSDWKTEPRSNRYHYATRFARTVPVLFFQHLDSQREEVSIEATEIENLDIVNVNCGIRTMDAHGIRDLLFARGIRNPLIWIYDPLRYHLLLEYIPNGFRVFHATEDYLTETGSYFDFDRGRLNEHFFTEFLGSIDFLVGCTNGVAQSYVSKAKYRGRYAVIENGCDAEFFLGLAERLNPQKTSVEKRVIYQGGINRRLDYRLLIDTVRLLPDWRFDFFGAAGESPDWAELKSEVNVRHWGAISPEKLGKEMIQSTVGIIPYIQDKYIQNSLPLKAYEYVACGLPVITVPIDALKEEGGIIEVANSAGQFADKIVKTGKTRHDKELLLRRRKVAIANSYDARFKNMTTSLLEAKRILGASYRKLRIAFLYSELTTHIETIREHLDAFDKYSRHHITYIPGTAHFWGQSDGVQAPYIDFSAFDVVIIHYSLRLSLLDYISENITDALKRFVGLKMLFLQDEYEGTEIARNWIEALKIDVVYTCVPEAGREFVYPSYRFPATEFLPTLTGYVPENTELEHYSRPLSQRNLLIAYRGRKLHGVYGELGNEKYRIGVEIKIIAGMRGLPVDIEVDDSKRIYGSAWYEFLASARATLGTESGANVFDFDGCLRTEINRLTTENPEITFEEISAKVLASHEGRVLMNQISPKVFEAIRLRTALVLFEGSYSGVVRPNEHYIPLKKDFSNIDEVLGKLKDDEYLQKLTDRAYQDIVACSRFSYRSFVEGVDADIERRVLRSNTRNLLLGPLFFVAPDGSLKQALPTIPLGVAVGSHPLGCPMSLVEIAAILPTTPSSKIFPAKSTANSQFSLSSSYTTIYRTMRWSWHRLPFSLRNKLVRFACAVLRRNNSENQRQKLMFRIARRCWRLLPLFIRLRLARSLEPK